MKMIQYAVVGGALVWGGCIAIPAPYADRLDPVGSAYAAVAVGTTREQVEAQFGSATRIDVDSSATWEARIDELNYNALKIWFDSQGKAQKIETTRAHGKVSPSYRASAVTLREK